MENYAIMENYVIMGEICHNGKIYAKMETYAILKNDAINEKLCIMENYANLLNQGRYRYPSGYQSKCVEEFQSRICTDLNGINSDGTTLWKICQTQAKREWMSECACNVRE